MAVQREVIKPVVQQVNALYGFIWKLKFSLFYGVTYIIAGGLTMMYLLLLNGTAGGISIAAALAYAIGLTMVLSDWFDARTEWVMAGSFVVLAANAIGLAFAIYSAPFILVLIFVTALALGAWMLWAVALLIKSVLESWQVRSDRAWLNSVKVEVAKLERFVVLYMPGGDVVMVDDKQTGDYVEYPDELTAYRAIDAKLRTEKAA